jgi:hypothetical protein
MGACLVKHHGECCAICDGECGDVLWWEACLCRTVCHMLTCRLTILLYIGIHSTINVELQDARIII